VPVVGDVQQRLVSEGDAATRHVPHRLYTSLHVVFANCRARALSNFEKCHGIVLSLEITKNLLFQILLEE
jgi:hypothetical protein